MPKRKRNSTWYRHLKQENDEIYKDVFCANHSCRPITEHTKNEENTDPGCINDNVYYNSGLSESVSDLNLILNEDDSTAELEINNLSQSDSSCSYSFYESESDSSSNNDRRPESLVAAQPAVEFKSVNTIDKLRDWVVTTKLPSFALKDLLEVLSNAKTEDFIGLPKDPRTFLRTPKKITTRKVSPGEYYHIGIQNSIENLYKNEKPSEEIIVIGINIDGLPLAKSSSSQVYPILGVINFKGEKNVFLIGIYHGYEKPKDFNEFLLDFVHEATDLITNGLKIHQKIYQFKISMFLFDAVAKSSVLYIKGHSGYHSCSKCTQEGDYIQDRVCFPEFKFTKRTHESFVTKMYPEHHTGTSILLTIPNIDIITDVPLDYMHLVLLGVVKKLLCGIWCTGPPPHKFSSLQIKNVSDLLENLKSFIPSEFARKPRSLKEVKRWKATEYRQFFLYTGPVVLKNNLPK
ncbi:unnamed protein product [Brassicogethes aeneus]|uniref:Transposase domain-containing protein n=1 Tax=Brassicogethes aeneus TaxID=1431903 RepID=A0A9P0BFD1_BRAAE|nr:unnamed protein product [Brassicogethes aeneus]